MKLEFIEDFHAPWSDEVKDHLVRLYAFDQSQAKQFRELVRHTIIENEKSLDLTKVDFIKVVNCSLILRISNEDVGITTDDMKNFFCDLTINGYENLINLIESICNDNRAYHYVTYQWLYDIDTPIEFLFSPTGAW